jgi:class 3 adenylate cyclase
MSEQSRTARRLAAILAADVAGCLRLMGTDEEGTLAALWGHRRELIDPLVAKHQGRIVKTPGDGLLIEFASNRLGAIRHAHAAIAHWARRLPSRSRSAASPWA